MYLYAHIINNTINKYALLHVDLYIQKREHSIFNYTLKILNNI